MTPKAYTIGNFKAIGAPQTIELKPITLIFGKNSAGKSSIIQSLLLCRHAMEKGNFDFTSTKRWGQTIDLGGFRQYIHRHEADRDLHIGFSFERSEGEKTNHPQDSQIERQTVEINEQLAPPWSFSFFNFVSELSVEFEIGFPQGDEMSLTQMLGTPGERAARVRKMTIKADGDAVVLCKLNARGQLSIEANLENPTGTRAVAQMLLTYIRSKTDSGSEAEVDLLELAESLGDAPTQSKYFDGIKSLALDCYTAELAKDNNDEIVELLAQTDAFEIFLWHILNDLPDQFRASRQGLTLSGAGLNLGLKNRTPEDRIDVVADEDNSAETGTSLGKGKLVEVVDDPVEFFLTDPDNLGDGEALAKAMRFDLEKMVEGVLNSLSHWLIGTQYICLHPSIPGRFFQIAESDDTQILDHGYRTLREIARNPSMLREISDIFQGTLYSPYRLEVRVVAPSLDYDNLKERIQRHLELESQTTEGELKTGVESLMNDLSEGKTTKGVYLVDTRNGTEVDFCDVGFGIGQVLPLVAEIASDRSGMICIEQPEIHLHPQMQSNLADIFIQQVSTLDFFEEVPQNVFILETHSEHIVLRLQRRIRESYHSNRAETPTPFTRENLSVSWVEARPEGAVVTALKVDERGRFIDDWPDGFFEERMDEMF